MKETPVQLTHETSEQIRTRAELDHCLSNFGTAWGRSRRVAARRLREIARSHPWLGDAIPDDVWAEIYHVGAVGTAAPPSRQDNHE